MSVSKRLRFEILRRDNHTCRYCGRSAPDVKLTVDHVLAVALGGPDEASNLITACTDCNSGKSSMPVDAALVENVKADALRWRAALQRAVNQAEQDRQSALEYCTRFADAWNSWRSEKGAVPLDDGWEVSIENFRARGLPIEHLLDCIAPAMTRANVAVPNLFRYACGIAWNKITAIEDAARAIFEQETRGAPSDSEPDANPVATQGLRAIAFIAPPVSEPEPEPVYTFAPALTPVEGDELVNRISHAMTAAATFGTQPNLIKLARQLGISPALMNDTLEAMGGFTAVWSRAQREQFALDSPDLT